MRIRPTESLMSVIKKLREQSAVVYVGYAQDCDLFNPVMIACEVTRVFPAMPGCNPNIGLIEANQMVMDEVRKYPNA